MGKVWPLTHLAGVKVGLVLQLCNLEARGVAVARGVALVVEKNLILKFVVLVLEALDGQPLLLLKKEAVRFRCECKSEASE